MMDPFISYISETAEAPDSVFFVLALLLDLFDNFYVVVPTSF